MAVDLEISEGLEWGASNKLAYALLGPIRNNVQSKAPHLADLLESGMMYGGASLKDLNADEFRLFYEGVSQAIEQRFVRYTSFTRRSEDGEWLEDLLGGLQHIIRLAFILTIDGRYVVESSETLISTRQKMALYMIAAQCLIDNLNLGIRLLVLSKDDQLVTTLSDIEHIDLCRAITHVHRDQTRSRISPKYDLRIKHINDAIDGQLAMIAALFQCNM